MVVSPGFPTVSLPRITYDAPSRRRRRIGMSQRWCTLCARWIDEPPPGSHDWKKFVRSICPICGVKLWKSPPPSARRQESTPRTSSASATTERGKVFMVTTYAPWTAAQIHNALSSSFKWLVTEQNLQCDTEKGLKRFLLTTDNDGVSQRVVAYYLSKLPGEGWVVEF